MKGSVRLGRIAGVPVAAHWTTLLVLALFATVLATSELPATAPGYSTAAYWVVAVLLAGVFLASILAHELAHAAVARYHGIAVGRITLWLLGGVAQLEEEAKDPESELRIAVAGPAASLAIGAASGCIALGVRTIVGASLLVGALGWLSMVSVVLAVFNLLPGAPLDGGRVLTAVLWRRSGDQRAARRRSAEAGQTLGQVLIGLGVFGLLVGAGIGGIWLMLLGWFLMGAARNEREQIELAGVLDGVCVAEVMTTRPAVARRGSTIAEFVAQQVGRAHGSSFPIVDDRGQVSGLVTFRRVAAVPPDEWTSTTVDDVALHADELWVAAPHERLLDVLARGRGGDGRIVVLDHGQLVGIVSPVDVTEATQRLRLRADLAARARHEG